MFNCKKMHDADDDGEEQCDYTLAYNSVLDGQKSVKSLILCVKM